LYSSFDIFAAKFKRRKGEKEKRRKGEKEKRRKGD
jgi:hypothetical protein